MAGGPAGTFDLAYADKLWQAADKLRGTVDAAEYKHVVVGLLFLKYISDSFATRRARLKEELEADGIKGEHMEKRLEDRDEHIADLDTLPAGGRYCAGETISLNG
jgi:type I restriction enzyme M protein